MDFNVTILISVRQRVGWEYSEKVINSCKCVFQPINPQSGVWINYGPITDSYTRSTFNLVSYCQAARDGQEQVMDKKCLDILCNRTWCLQAKLSFHTVDERLKSTLKYVA